MRINQPSDELGGMLLLMLPSRVIHHIDAWSPLLPEHLRYPIHPSSATSAAQQAAGFSPMNSYRYPQIRLRAMDAMQGNRAVIESEVTGEAFSTQTAYENHHRREKITDSGCVGGGDGHGGVGVSPISPTSHLQDDQLLSALETHFRENHVEILVIVEGIDPTCSQTLQSCYSYTADDFRFNTHDYAECFRRKTGGARGGALMVNYHRFQELVPLDDNNESDGTDRGTASSAAAAAGSGDMDRAARSV